MPVRGQEARQPVQDPNMLTGRENPNKIQMPTAPIRSPRMPSSGGGGTGGGIGNAFGNIFSKLEAQQQNKDFLAGQMAYVQGQVEADIAATGNKTTMAGYMSLAGGVMAETWLQQEIDFASTDGAAMAPEQYQARLHESASSLLAQAGGDEYTQRILMGGIEKAFMTLTGAQTRANKAYTLDQTETNLRNNLLGVSSNAASEETVLKKGAGPEGQYYTQQTVKPQGNYIDAIIQIESAGNPNAKNPFSTASGLGQFTEGTWLSTIRRHRPDLIQGKSRQEILNMRFNGAISREMVGHLISDNHSILSKAGVQLTAGNTYLAHFAGAGGAIRIAKGNRNAHVSSVMSAAQIEANAFLKNWTVGQLQDWASKKMVKHGAGQHVPAAQRAQAQVNAGGTANVQLGVQDLIFTDHGLPPKRHVALVADTMVAQMATGDASLFEQGGGIDTLIQLGATNAQLEMVSKAHQAYISQKETEYSSERETAISDAEKYARETGDLEGALERLNAADQKFDISDQTMLTYDKRIRASVDAKNDPMTDPAIRADLFELRQSVLDGADLEEGLIAVSEMAEQAGFTPEQISAAYGSLETAAETAANNNRKRVASAAEEYAKEKAADEKALVAASTGTLFAEDEKTQERGTKLIRENVYKAVMAEHANGAYTQTGPAGQPVANTDAINGEISRRVSEILVRNDTVDKTAAKNITAALVHDPLVTEDGEPKLTERQILAYTHILELQRAGADDEYIGRMFKDYPEAALIIEMAQQFDTGDADTTTALLLAKQAVANVTDTEQALKAADKMADGLVEEYTARVFNESGADPSLWDWVTGRAATTGTEFLSTTTTADEARRAMESPELRSTWTQHFRTNMLLKGATPEAAAALATKQTISGGDFIMGSYVPASKAGTLSQRLGLSTKGETNLLVMDYIREHGASVYGEKAWADNVERNHYVLDELGYGTKMLLGTLGRPFTGSSGEEVQTWASPKATRAESARRVPHGYISYDPVNDQVIFSLQQRLPTGEFVMSTDTPMVIPFSDLVKQRDKNFAPQN